MGQLSKILNSVLKAQERTIPIPIYQFIKLRSGTMPSDGEFAAMGLRPCIVTGNGFTNPDGTISETLTKASALNFATISNVLIPDFEGYNYDPREVGNDVARAKLKDLAQIADWIHEAVPEMRVGFYSFLPYLDYWHPINFDYGIAKATTDQPYWINNLAEFETNYNKWKAANDFSASILLNKVDILVPSVYTFYNDDSNLGQTSVEGQHRYMLRTLMESRRIGNGKPVMPFVWPRYHQSNPTLGLKFIEGIYWYTQLKQLASEADGMFIWLVDNGGLIWDPTLPWYTETLKFVRELV